MNSLLAEWSDLMETVGLCAQPTTSSTMTASVLNYQL